MPPSRSGRKRGKSSPPVSRAKKKHKRLDAICDKPFPAPPILDLPSDDDDPGQLRRSSRARRAPQVLDSSPIPSNRRKQQQPPNPPVSPTPNKKDNQLSQLKKTKRQKKKSLPRSLSFQEEEEGESEGWRSRLRSRAKEGKTKGKTAVVNDSGRVSRKGKASKRKRVAREDIELIKADRDEDVEKLSEDEEEKVAPLKASQDSARAAEGREEEEEEEEAEEEEDDEEKVAPLKNLEDSARDAEGREVEGVEVEEGVEQMEDVDEEKIASDLKELESSEQVAVEAKEEGGDECANDMQEAEADKEMEKIVPGGKVDAAETVKNTNNNAVTCEKSAKEGDVASPMSDNKLSSSRVKEGRRCGLCGGGTDGKPPKKLVRESVDSDNEAYEGSSASEEPNYDIWDGFGDEPGWLGRLLGPIHDRFGIARVWVHQHCAVWSPEVYFAGLGCLKNVRAALCRGKALKCSHCGRPGATIGCRVDRCPKTYHLPCSRAEGCIFDHRKFLIACNDHRQLFQPQGISYSHQIRKRKARKLKLEMRKFSNDAWRKDVEDEEKWLEHCGEDEEFLKREGKRLHRDILRIAPTYIGGSSENELLYQGWESVAGLQGVIQCMKEVVILPLLYPDFFSNLSLTPPRGVLLHGYPGTGKTLVVRALIGACSRGDKRIAYFARKGADCLGKYVGDAERQLRLLFQVAEKSQPSIIFFDEIDGLAPVRSRHQDQTHSSVVSTLLSLMDGLKSRGSVIVIGATNRPEAIDPALRRPGRFDREIYFPLPSEKDRSAILSLHTRSWPNPLSGTLLSWIANRTVGYAGADLQALCTQAAMNALKRNSTLKELLSYAEEGSVHGRLPSLPSLIVEEREWLTALALAPPPCSRREAGMAANDVVTSPLPYHLTPCLLEPLSLLLISFYNDERIWTPPVLAKAAESIRSIVISSLEQRQLPTSSWWSHLHHLIKEKYILKDIEANLSHYGLISVPSVGVDSFMSNDDNDDQKFDSFTLRRSAANIHRSMKLFSPMCQNLSGFRILISGSPRSGQQHLASCLLHCFMGHVEVQKVNLATISQEGHGDLLRGSTQILSKCLNFGRCIIYMPRIDLWAINESSGEDVEESHTTSMPCRSLAATVGTTSVSEIWNSFVEQVYSACTSTSLIILATCEIQNHDLPLGIKQFFTSDLSHAVSATREHTVPRFFVHIEGTFDHELVLNSSAAKLSTDLVRNFVQLLHHRNHPSRSQEKTTVSNALGVNSETQQQSVENGTDTGSIVKTEHSEQIDFSTRVSCKNDQNQQVMNSDPLSVISEHQEAGIHPSSHRHSFPKILPCKATMGNSTLAIATFGYQILRCPQFAELCWVTSKLRAGPCTDINGPWKGWPFNSCVMHDSASPDTVSAGSNSGIQRDNSGVVRGLTAVGLLSYRGVYTSVREVATEVRKVLELLVGQVRAKILNRKDRYQYLRILSQVAYLEDMVNSWAYKFQSSHTNNPIPESYTRPVFAGRLSTENNSNGNNLAGSQSCLRSFLNKSSTEAVETLLAGSSAKSNTSNGQCIDLSKGLSNHSLPKSDMHKIPETEHLQKDVPSAPLSSNVHSSPPLATTLVREDLSCRTEGPGLNKSLDSLKQFIGLEMTKDSLVFDDPNNSANATKFGSKDIDLCCNGLDTGLSSKDAELLSKEPCKVPELTLRKSGNILAALKTSCLYTCCSGCLNALYVLARHILSECWESNGRCSTVEDIDNVVSSCSLNLLAKFRNFNVSESGNNTTEYCHKTPSEHCACEEVGSKQFKQMSYQNKASENMFLAADNCNCHLRNEGNTMVHTESDSPFQQSFTYFFRDGVLVSSEPQKDEVLHCRYDKFCLCSMVEMILTVKKPMN